MKEFTSIILQAKQPNTVALNRELLSSLKKELFFWGKEFILERNWAKKIRVLEKKFCRPIYINTPVLSVSLYITLKKVKKGLWNANSALETSKNVDLQKNGHHV